MDDIKRIPLRLNIDLHTRFKICTTQKHQSMQEVMIELIEQYLQENENK